MIVDGRVTLAQKPYSKHPGDKHLTVVLCQWGEQFVTWAHNEQDHGFFWGHYFTDKREAFKDFQKRPHH